MLKLSSVKLRPYAKVFLVLYSIIGGVYSVNFGHYTKLFSSKAGANIKHDVIHKVNFTYVDNYGHIYICLSGQQPEDDIVSMFSFWITRSEIEQLIKISDESVFLIYDVDVTNIVVKRSVIHEGCSNKLNFPELEIVAVNLSYSSRNSTSKKFLEMQNNDSKELTVYEIKAIDTVTMKEKASKELAVVVRTITNKSLVIFLDTEHTILNGSIYWKLGVPLGLCLDILTYPLQIYHWT